MTHKVIRKKVQLASLIFFLVFGSSVLSPVAIGANPEVIPIGCPGSQLQGPPPVDMFGNLPYDCDDPSTWPGATAAAPQGLPADCTSDNAPNPNESNLHPDNCEVMGYIQLITRGLTALVGVIVVMMIVIGGIQYSSAGSNPQAVAAAKKRISNALLALTAYIFASAFLQWLIPGGVF